jgi:hypothetical protein
VLSLVGALQAHISLHSMSGLTDVSASLEVLISQMLAVTEGLTLQRLNLFRLNYPSIDLADVNRRVAIQVTSNATTEKWKDTVEKFAQHGLSAQYDELRIVGFCKAVKPRALPAHVKVEGPSAITGAIKSLDSNKLVELETLLRKSYDFSRLAPLSDKDCFMSVLRVVDRDALRHYASVEGSYADAAAGLKEMREIITTGKVAAKDIYAKPLGQYSSTYEDVLHRVDLNLSQMIAEINRARSGTHYYLTEDQKRKIDEWRSSIIDELNVFCRDQGIDRRIQGQSWAP